MGVPAWYGSTPMVWQRYSLCFSLLKNFRSRLTAGQKIVSTCTDMMDQDWISILLHRAYICMLWKHQHVRGTCGVWLPPCQTRLIYMTINHVRMQPQHEGYKI